MLREIIDVTEDYHRMKVELNDLYEHSECTKNALICCVKTQLYNATYINSQL